MRYLLFFLVVLVTNRSFSQSKAETAIRNILTEQNQAWNNGNIDAFMSGYWQNDSLMFIGNDGITFGWKKTLQNYKKSYPDTAAMGKLNFELLEVKRLSPAYFFVIGKWRLTRTVGNIGGAFTLLFRKEKNKWVIVADHSS